MNRSNKRMELLGKADIDTVYLFSGSYDDFVKNDTQEITPKISTGKQKKEAI